jgi:hypothetical protein
MAKRKKSKLDLWAPAFGLWNETEKQTPPAASTFLAMWPEGGPAYRLGDCCCYYYDADGKKVDPEEKPHATVRYWQLRGEKFVEVPAPVMWCETRWVIPVGRAWEKAHGLN